jgi:hypothetical protein
LHEAPGWVCARDEGQQLECCRASHHNMSGLLTVHARTPRLQECSTQIVVHPICGRVACNGARFTPFVMLFLEATVRGHSQTQTVWEGEGMCTIAASRPTASAAGTRHQQQSEEGRYAELNCDL